VLGVNDVELLVFRGEVVEDARAGKDDQPLVAPSLNERADELIGVDTRAGKVRRQAGRVDGDPKRTLAQRSCTSTVRPILPV
jgi:hypothetical protein